MGKRIYISFILILLWSCSKSYEIKLEKTELKFYKGKFNSSLKEIKPLIKKSKIKDRLLYLMEAGIILHSAGYYKKSNVVFKEADFLSEIIKKSISKQALSFMLSDRNANYRGENFERVLIKFYIALNYIMLGEYENAKIYFKKLEFDLKYMKYTENKYKQNLAARYLNAILSEYLGKYNDARVQYRNIMMFNKNNKSIYADRLILALKEKDEEDITKYKNGGKQILAFNRDLKRVDYNTNMGELVIVYEAGKAAIKKSRGRLLNDEQFYIALRAAIEIVLRSKKTGLSTASVLAMLTTAENPIPVYKKRDVYKEQKIDILLNGKKIGKTYILNDYSKTAIKNFNENYSRYITKNVLSIATKIVLAAVAANELSRKSDELAGGNVFLSSFSRIAIGASVGSAVASTIKPDLRCWLLLPSNFQIIRIFLEPGEYNFNINSPSNKEIKFTDYPNKINIKRKDLKFINIRSY